MTQIYQNKRALIDAVIQPDDTVLDIGFFGQGITAHSTDSAHYLLKKRAKEVWGVDLEYDDTIVDNPAHYIHGNAETFAIDNKFSVIFAGDLIEHLSNPGLFLETARRHLEAGGRLVMTTPNTFNLFNLTEKLSKDEPTVNPDHTFYFNKKTLRVLLQKNDWELDSVDYLYSLGELHKESWKKKFLNVLYKVLSLWTPKFIETLVVVATPKKTSL